MNKPLSYFELVVETVRGRTPIPEFNHHQKDQMPLALKHIEYMKSLYPSGKSGNEFIDLILESGPQLLCTIWSQMSPSALTMCGDKNLNLLIEAMQTVEKEKIHGDFIETGVWRGGLPIIMRAYLESIGNRERKVIVADSFQGLPDDAQDPNDQAAHLLLQPLQHLAASREQVEASLDFFGLKDEQVIFLEGWFKDTLPKLESKQLAIARLDGDYFESTWDAITVLYPKLSPGGYLIVDDYNLPLGCKHAIDEYRAANDIHEEIIEINGQSVYWRKA
jgi:O-methyltransferase